MKKHTLVIALLVVLLIGSNGWWAYKVLDAGVSHTYLNASLEEAQQGLSQALAVIKASARPNVTRAQIIESAQKAWSSVEPFEKDGYIWVGRLGFRFNEQGRLVDVIAG